MNELIASAALVAVGIIAWGVIRYFQRVREDDRFSDTHGVIAFPQGRADDDNLVVERPVEKPPF